MGRYENCTLPQTHKVHCYPISSSQLTVAETSDDATEFKIISIYKSKTSNENHSLSSADPDSESDVEARQDEAFELSIKVGHCVIVKNDDTRYPGEVTSS